MYNAENFIMILSRGTEVRSNVSSFVYTCSDVDRRKHRSIHYENRRIILSSGHDLPIISAPLIPSFIDDLPPTLTLQTVLSQSIKWKRKRISKEKKASNFRFTATDLINRFLLFCSPVDVLDGPTNVKVNIFLRSISKIDDYNMVSAIYK